METDIRLTLAERDRRYAAIRERLRLRTADCVIAVGSNLFYLTNGLPGERFGLLPTAEGTFLTAVIHRRYFVDLSPQVLADAQDWVKDLRSGIDATPLVARIRELGLENGDDWGHRRKSGPWRLESWVLRTASHGSSGR